MQRRMAAAFAALVVMALPGCDSVEATPDTAGADADRPFEWPTGPHPVVVLEISEPEGLAGEIAIELYPELAPNTVDNFLDLAAQDFYDGTTFHRVVDGFMIQGGDPNTKDKDPDNDGQGGPRYSIDDEFNPAPHVRGTVSMANAGRENSGGSQFFIVHADSRDLDGRYTAFGRVIRGMDVVDKIAKAEVDVVGRWGPKNRPLENIVVGNVVVNDVEAGAAADRRRKAEASEASEGEGVDGADAGTAAFDQAELAVWSDDTIRSATESIELTALDSPRAEMP